MNFYKFLESRLNESNDEMGFIRSFFSSFASFNSFDKTALLVFADWLKDHDDPREDLVRLCGNSENLKPTRRKTELAGRLGISGNNWVLYTGNLKLDTPPHETPTHYVVKALGDNSSRLWLDTDSIQWTKQDEENSPITVNQVDNKTLSVLFWSLLGYGWGLN